MATFSVYNQTIKEGLDIWIPSQATVWEQAKVLDISGALATLRKKNDDSVSTLDLSQTIVWLCNPTLSGDVTGLHYVHEPGILYNLEQRSYRSEPYTLLGSVLVAVNPLRRIPDPPGIIGNKKATTVPHPYMIAEVAFQQMVFTEGQKAKQKGGDDIGTSNQSVVISGESGSGKTESAKYVLRHLVARNDTDGGVKDLDDRLLGSNPILEAFGNASTVRNHNSSRFGKFLKLHFKSTARAGDTALWTIAGASVVTYLLERSRITTHNNGERGYHIFYQLVNGAPADVKKACGLDKTNVYRYTTPRADTKKPEKSTRLQMDDKEDYKATDAAFRSLGISAETKMFVYKTLAGLLHLGNVEFDNEERPEGDVAIVRKGGYGALELAGENLGIEPEKLATMLREHEVQAGAEMVTKRRNADAASYARDAVAKAAYSALFDWVVDTVNKALVLENGIKPETLPFIGVLDIFGFESFEMNDFEQLLINYTNEALQGTFNRAVFIAELDLYKKEGLFTDDGGMAAPPDNSSCMKLLAGDAKTMGLLKMIDAESQTPQANDQKMVKQLHRAFEKHECMLKPHPKDAASTFIIRHYAGAVVYTVGRFIEKNADRLPKEVANTFATSSSPLVSILFTGGVSGADKAAKAKSTFGGASIIAKFTGQIAKLIETLESTRDSFIRCVKPSIEMIRKDGDDTWFDRRYVTMQLKNLSIPQTAEVLKSGLPTRVPYDVLCENYMSVMPADAITIWKKLGGGDMRAFMTAIFWAFEVPPDCYRCGITKVFFKSGELSKLDQVMEAASKWASAGGGSEEQAKVVKRFKYYYVRMMWRKNIVKQMCVNRFAAIAAKARSRVLSAAKIQALFRMNHARLNLRRWKRGAIMAQKLYRARVARKIAEKWRALAIAEAKRKAEEAKRLEEEARARQLAEAEAAEKARIQAEEEAKKAAEEGERQAALKRLEDLKREEEERAKRAAEEAEKLRAERLHYEGEEARKIREQEEREKREKEEREKKEAEIELELKKMQEEEQKRKEDEEAMAKRTKGMSGRAKSITRLRGKSMTQGVSEAAKKSQIEAAEMAIRKEHETWSNSTKNGYFYLQVKGGLFGGKKWKKVFFMVKLDQRKFEIYDKGNSTGKVGEPKDKPKNYHDIPKGECKFNKVVDKKLPAAMSVSGLGGTKGPLLIGADAESDLKELQEALNKASKGFSASPEKIRALENAKALKVHVEGAVEEEEIDISLLPLATQEQLAKIESLLETGLLRKEEVDQLKPHIIAQGKEAMKHEQQTQSSSMRFAQGGRPTYVAGRPIKPTNLKPVPTTDQILGYNNLAAANVSPDVMVVCSVCSILNMHGGKNCTICGALLPAPDAPEQRQKVRQRASIAISATSHINYGGFQPEDGKWLCAFTYRGNGTFRCFMKEAVSVMDQQTWEQTAVYVLGCEFTQGMVQEQWTTRHNWNWWQKWHAKMASKGEWRMPDFPKVEKIEETSTNKNTMRKLKGLLSDYLGNLLKSIKPSDAARFLETPDVDDFFKIKQNVHTDLNFEDYQESYDEVLRADLSASDANIPLTEDEIRIADDAATLLLTFIRGEGDTKSMDPFDPKVQDLKGVCIAAVPRLKASMDPNNPYRIDGVMDFAGDTLQHVENALRTCIDTELVRQGQTVAM